MFSPFVRFTLTPSLKTPVIASGLKTILVRGYSDSEITLHMRIKKDMMTGMKAKEKKKVQVLKSILSEIVYVQKQSPDRVGGDEDSVK
eukprot:Awhi_evm1s1124